MIVDLPLMAAYSDDSEYNLRSVRIIARAERFFFLPKATLNAWWLDGLTLVKRARVWVGQHRTAAVIFAVFCAATIVALMPYDRMLLKSLRQCAVGSHFELLNRAAIELSFWGDFLGFNMLVFVGLGLTARLRGSLFFRRLLIAAVLGSVLSGGLANVSRTLTGRSRPSEKSELGFHGPSLSANRHSFPSAHSATTFGASVPVAVALPPVGIPMLILSSGVAWSRMQNNRHHPSDVFASVALSILLGVPLGMVVRRTRRTELQVRRKRITTSVQLDLAPLNPSTTIRVISGNAPHWASTSVVRSLAGK